VETFDNDTGFWELVKMVPVVWPIRRVFKLTWYLNYVLQLVEDVGDLAAIKEARRKAHDLTKTVTTPTRIIEVKSNGSRFTIWQGRWIEI
jgi:hypothetical protein